MASPRRIVFMTETPDDHNNGEANINFIGEAKHKLSPFRAGYGKFEKTHYWSLSHEDSHQAYQVLKSLFKIVRRA